MASPLDAAIRAARAAGEIQRDGLRRPIIVKQQSAHDVKLQTDVACEERIRDLLQDAFPGYAFLAEEGGGAIAPDGPTWIVDPLDGTVNYSRRIPHFCVSIALRQAGEEVLGVVYDPINDELFTAEAGGGARLNGARIRVSETRHLRDAIVAVGSGKGPEIINRMAAHLRHLSINAKKVRIMGAAALDLAYVAMGRYDGFYECGLRTWDIAAGALFVREAGGRVEIFSAGDHAWDVRVDNGRVFTDLQVE